MTDWEAIANALADFIRDRMADWPTEDVVDAEKLLNKHFSDQFEYMDPPEQIDGLEA